MEKFYIKSKDLGELHKKVEHQKNELKKLGHQVKRIERIEDVHNKKEYVSIIHYI